MNQLNKNAFKIVAILLGLSLVMFQNCGVVPNGECPDGDSSCNKQNTTSSSSSSSSGTQGSYTGGSSSSSGAGYSNVGTGGRGTSGSGGSNYGSGSAVPAPGGGLTSSGGPLSISQQPQSITVDMGQSFTLTVGYQGGTGPYQFQWYFNGSADTSGFGTYYSYFATANRYDQEGSYYLVIKDAAGASIRSATATVTVRDPAINCPARAYYTKLADTSYISFLSSLFVNSRGIMFWPASYAELAPLNLDSMTSRSLSTLGLGKTTSLPAGTFAQVIRVPCATAIPAVHSPTPNPEWNYEWGGSEYQDSARYKYEGNTSFECRGGKWLFKANTCQWKYYPPPASDNVY